MALLLRLALVFVAGLALLLAVMSFLRPRPKDADDDQEDGEGEEDSEHAAAPWPGATDGFVPSSPGETVLFEYHKLQLELVRTRSHRRPHQTPIEHGRKFAGRHSGLDLAFEKLHRLVYKTLYAGRTAAPDDIDEARRSCRRIRRHLT